MLLAGRAWGEAPGPVFEPLEASVPEKDVAAFHAGREDEVARAIAGKLVRDLRAFDVRVGTPFHFRHSDKTLDFYFSRESDGRVSVVAARLVFLLDAAEECYGYTAGVASLALRRTSLEAAFSATAPDRTRLASELRAALRDFGVGEKSAVEVRPKPDGELLFLFTNGPAANFPSVEAFVWPWRENGTLRSFSFAIYAYPAGADPRRAIGRRTPLPSGPFEGAPPGDSGTLTE
jgi:hypothetical protein